MSGRTNRWIRRVLQIMVMGAAATVLVGGCSSGGAERVTGSTTSTTADPRVVPPPGGTAAWLELERTTVEPGGTIVGAVVVVNDTGSPLRLVCGSNPYEAGFETGFGVTSMPRTLACGAPGSVPVGESRWPIQVHVQYPICGNEPSTRYPQCQPDGRPPAVPNGLSRVVVSVLQPAPASVPIPTPIEITVE